MVARQVHIVKHIDVDHPSTYQTDIRFAFIINQFEAYKKLNKNVKTSCNKRKRKISDSVLWQKHIKIQKATWQHKKNATKNFDYTTIADYKEQ